MKTKKLMKAIGKVASEKLDEFNAQECSKLLYAMEKSGVQHDALQAAATKRREQDYSFDGIDEALVITHIIGGGRNLQQTREATGTTGATGGALWEDSHLLAKWFSLNSQTAHLDDAVRAVLGKKSKHWSVPWCGKTVVELGAGLGLCSIVCGALGMHVVATDGDEQVLKLQKDNVSRNAAIVKKAGGSVRVAKLEWGAADPLERLGLENPPDLIMATGVVYGKDIAVWEALSKTILSLTGSKTLVLMAHGNGAAPGVHKLKGSFYEYMQNNRYKIANISSPKLLKNHKGCQIHALGRKKKTRLIEEEQAQEASRKKAKKKSKACPEGSKQKKSDKEKKASKKDKSKRKRSRDPAAEERAKKKKR